MALAALKDRTMMPNGKLVPWKSPMGKSMKARGSGAAGSVDGPLLLAGPQRSTLDYVANAPYRGRYGVMKQSFNNGLYISGLPPSGFYAPAGTDPSADVTNWLTRLSAGEPYDGDPASAATLNGRKIAVIENEFGEENIDNEILVADTTEQILQLSNGCVCCTIREDLRATLATLAEKRRKGELDFERVVIETTGLADPGPVAQTFFMDDEIAESYLLDSILTLVDAKHADGQLDARQEARRQVGFADQIFISKSELVDAATVDALTHRLKHMNPRAPQRRVHFGEVPIAEVFDLRGFNLNAKLEIDPEFLRRRRARPSRSRP